jgi:hypothetical protein
LEIAVNGNELSPRQPITRAPYSIQTRGIFVDEDQNVGIGTMAPDALVEIQADQNVTEYIHLSGFDNDNASIRPVFKFRRARGSAAVPAVVANGDRIGSIIAEAYDGATPRRPASIEFLVDGAPGSGDMPGRIEFQTAPDGDTVRVTRMTVSNNGNVGIGTATPNHPLHIISSTNGGVRVETSGAASGGDGVTSEVEGIFAFAITGIDLSGNGLAGHFQGDVDITGTLSKSGGSFKIDHPLDPANKFLSHSFVESPDMMNIYNGNAILDGSGRATITLPDWFEALNREFRYQLTCIGGFATVYVESEIENNQFTIAGGNAGLKVSWQVTGVRQDAWAEANRIPVEEQKVGFEAGHYLHPEVYDLDRSMSILAAREAHLSVPESKAAMNEFQEEKQIEATASRNTGKFHTPHTKRARQK